MVVISARVGERERGERMEAKEEGGDGTSLWQNALYLSSFVYGIMAGTY